MGIDFFGAGLLLTLFGVIAGMIVCIIVCARWLNITRIGKARFFLMFIFTLIGVILTLPLIKIFMSS